MPPRKSPTSLGKLVAVFVALVIVFVLFVVVYLPGWRGDVIVVSLGIILGFVGAFYYYESFIAKERSIEFGPDEKLLLETKASNVYLNVPKMVGGFMGEGPPIRVNLYLTDQSIVAEPLEYSDFDEEGRFFVFHIAHGNILRFSHEKKMRSNYLRIAFLGMQSEEHEVLLFPGADTEKWVENLQNLLA